MMKLLLPLSVLAMISSLLLYQANRPNFTRSQQPALTINNDSPRNFGPLKRLEGRIMYDDEAAAFLPANGGSALWVIDPLSPLRAIFAAKNAKDKLICVNVRGLGSLSSNLISKHAFIDYHAVRFADLEVGRIERNCILTETEKKSL